MRGIELLEAMGNLDARYIEAAEALLAVRKKTHWQWIAAACLVVTAAAIGIKMSEHQIELPPSPPVSQSVGSSAEELPLQVIYNEADGVFDAARQYTAGHFTELLSEEAVRRYVPDDGRVYEGAAAFDGEGNWLSLHLKTSSVALGEMNVIISRYAECDYIMDNEPVASEIGGIRYIVYSFPLCDGKITFSAQGEIGGYQFLFFTEADESSLHAAKAEFESVLKAFAEQKNPADPSEIKPREIPEFRDERIDFSKAQEDDNFGTYLPSAAPSGFAEETVRRYKDQNHDYLYCLWTRGYDELRWKISYFTEADAARQTSVADRINYDLSLYPIPRADSVPETLREIVDHPIFDAGELTADTVWARAYLVDDAGDSSGYRMHFSVCYGDVLVTVSGKGADPEWIWRQLVSLR